MSDDQRIHPIECDKAHRDHAAEVWATWEPLLTGDGPVELPIDDRYFEPRELDDVWYRCADISMFPAYMILGMQLDEAGWIPVINGDKLLGKRKKAIR